MSQQPPQPPQPPYPPQQPPYPPYGAGLSPFAYAAPVRSVRPGSVTTLAVIGIILSVLSILMIGCSLGASFLPQPAAGTNPVLDAIERSKGFQVYNAISTIVWALLSIHLLVVSIGSLNLKRWARGGMITNAWSYIVYAIVGSAISFVMLTPLLLPLMRSNDPAERFGAIGGLAGGVCVTVVMPIYPIFVLVYMRKPHVVEAFESAQSAAAAPR